MEFLYIDNEMPARRRRTGSETEPNLILANNNVGYIEKNNPNYRFPNNVQQDKYLEDEDYIETYIEPEPIMTARDRTNEFINTIQSLQGRNIARAVAANDPRKSRIIQSHTEFMFIAKNIGKNIASTYSKLEKLTLRMYK